jgi:hypothetical protein
MSDADKNYLEEWLSEFGAKLDRVLLKTENHEGRLIKIESEAPHCKMEQMKEIADLKNQIADLKKNPEKKWEQFWKNVGRIVLGAAGIGVVGGILFGLVYFLDAIKKMGLIKP